MDIKPNKVKGIKTSVTFSEKNYKHMRNYIDMINAPKESWHAHLDNAAVINFLLEDFFKHETESSANFERVNIKNKKKQSFDFTEDNLKNLKNYTQKFGLTYGDIINPLIENFLGDYVFSNDGYIELDNPMYFSKSELFEKGIVETCEDEVELGDDNNNIVVVERVPNNLDDFNTDNELSCYCRKGKPSVHAGIYIIPNFDGGEDYYLNILYDSDKESVKIRLINNIDNYFNNIDESELDMKEKLLSDVEEIKNRYNSDKDLTLYDLENYCIMYDYINRKNTAETGLDIPERSKKGIMISSKYKHDEDVKKQVMEVLIDKMFNNTLRGVLFKDFKP